MDHLVSTNHLSSHYNLALDEVSYCSDNYCEDEHPISGEEYHTEAVKNLREWFIDMNIGELTGFIVGFQFLHRLPIPQDIIIISQECRAGITPPRTFLSEVKEKKIQWFQCIMLLHYNNRLTENLTLGELGINQIFESPVKLHTLTNKVYCDYFTKLTEFHGARNIIEFNQLLLWLTNYPVDSYFHEECDFNSNYQFYDGTFRLFRPELASKLITIEKQLPFDNRTDDTSANYNKFLPYYIFRFVAFKFHLIKITLESAPKELSYHFFNDMLLQEKNESCMRHFYSAQYYPPNTSFHEPYPWLIPIDCLVSQLPDNFLSESKFLKEFAVKSQQNTEVEPLNLTTFTNNLTLILVFGRTLKLVDANGRIFYLKLQNKSESREDFTRNHAKIKLIWEMRDQLESKCANPVKLLEIEELSPLLSALHIKHESEQNLIKMTESHAPLAIQFEMDEDADYEDYFYDTIDSSQAVTAIKKYISDWAFIYKKGLIPPAAITLFHQFSTGRNYSTLCSFSGRYNIGSIESVFGKAVNFSNVGNSHVGMRDMGDTYLPEELKDGYFDYDDDMVVDETTESLEKKIRLNELAQTALSVIIMYARVNQSLFNIHDEVSINKVTSDLTDLLSCLFCKTFTLSQVEFTKIISDHIRQAALEVMYWLSENSSLTEDLKDRKVNKVVYSNLPSNLIARQLTEIELERLTPSGISSSLDDKSIQLGLPNGRNPLITSHLIICKTIAIGMCKIIDSNKRSSHNSSKRRSRCVIQ